MKQILSGIYKAHQCTDLNDVDQAIALVRSRLRLYGEKKCLFNRWNALNKRRAVIEKGATHG